MPTANLSIMNDSSEYLNYNNPALPLYVMHGSLSSFPHMEALCHWHKDIEFLIPIRGHISYRVNDKDFLIAEHHAIFVNARQMHYGYSSDNTDCDYICIVFDPSLISTNRDLSSRYITPITEHTCLTEFLFSPDNEEHQKVITALSELYRLYEQKISGYELLAVSTLYSMWSDLYRILHELIVDTSFATSSDLLIQKQMVQFIYDNFTEKLSLEAIAHSGIVSRTKCCQIFKKFLNRTPLDFLNSYRLENSMNLLCNTELSITEIAYKCGFNSLSYYSEIFRKYKGCTPYEFRIKSTCVI